MAVVRDEELLFLFLDGRKRAADHEGARALPAAVEWETWALSAASAG